MEGIGYSVFARIVPLSVADDLVGGMARIAWRSSGRSSSTNASAPEPRRAGNGSNGWNNLTGKLSQTNLQVGACVAHRDWDPRAVDQKKRNDPGKRGRAPRDAFPRVHLAMDCRLPCD